MVGCAAFDHSNDQPRPVTIRVLTYNIHVGIGMDKAYDLKRVAEVIRRVEPDVVAVQEVDRGTGRTNGDDQAALLAEWTGMHATFVKGIDHDGGEYGQVILTRVPPIDFERIELPHDPAAEKRVAGVVTLHTAGQRWRFVATHLDYRANSPSRLKQAATLNDTFGEAAVPTVLAGDLNATLGSETLQHFDGLWASVAGRRDDLHTFPADAPVRMIDHVFLTPPARWQIESVRVLDEPVTSDHRPVLAEVTLLPAP